MKFQLSAPAFWGIGIAAIVCIAGILFMLFRGSDPAAQPPKPAERFDYGAYRQQQDAKDPRTQRDATQGAATH